MWCMHDGFRRASVGRSEDYKSNGSLPIFINWNEYIRHLNLHECIYLQILLNQSVKRRDCLMTSKHSHNFLLNPPVSQCLINSNKMHNSPSHFFFRPKYPPLPPSLSQPGHFAILNSNPSPSKPSSSTLPMYSTSA